ncbi:class I SAM-dependent methyltransferase [Shinella sp. S4-D37]|uniref:hypothetical protein n=1 Tax=Shinella sp. S4-D37 TaxID=3161999 RepID=UPI003465D50C
MAHPFVPPPDRGRAPLSTLLPELAGRRIVDLGCGFGWFARHAAEAGGAKRARPRLLGIHDRPRTTDWLAKGVVKHHRTLGTTRNALTTAGFVLSHVEEWLPSEAQLAAHPEWKVERNRPMVLLIACERPRNGEKNGGDPLRRLPLR